MKGIQELLDPESSKECQTHVAREGFKDMSCFAWPAFSAPCAMMIFGLQYSSVAAPPIQFEQHAAA